MSPESLEEEERERGEGVRKKEKIVYMSSWGNKKNRNWLKVGKTFRRMQHRLRLHIRLGLVQQEIGSRAPRADSESR